MSQRPPYGSQNSQPGVLPTLLNNPHTNPQDTTSISHSRRVSIQEPPPIIHSRRVSIQEPLPTSHSRRVSIQEPLPTSHSRRVSIQEPLPTSHSRLVSIQEPLPTSHSRLVSIQEPLTSLGRRVSIQEPPSTSLGRRVSNQEPPLTSLGRQVSIQEPPLTSLGRRVSNQEPRSTNQGRHVSTQELLPSVQNRRVSIQDAPSAIYNRRFSNRESLSVYQTRHFSGQSALKHSSLANLESLTQQDNSGIQGPSSTTQSLQLSTQGLLSLAQSSSDALSLATHSRESNVKIIESIIWSSQENSKDSFSSAKPLQTPPDSKNHTFQSVISLMRETSRSHRRSSCPFTLLPFGWQLLHEAKKISRMVSLALSLAGMVIISLISLGQPWMHFQVPLRPPGDPAGSQTFPINTIFFVRCVDISCLREYDQNAYLLDCAWLFILISSLTGFCICITLLNTIFFTSSNLPMLDFSTFIASTLTGMALRSFPRDQVTSMILGVLFYLLQAQEYLQEGMTYRLGRSFYLAWTGILFFLMTGVISYLNYINFWSILAFQGIWA